MQQHTTEHLPLVDPTGRLPLVPSKAVTAVDKGFGLGHASQQAILLEEARWPDAGLTRALLPHKLRCMGAAADIMSRLQHTCTVRIDRFRDLHYSASAPVHFVRRLRESFRPHKQTLATGTEIHCRRSLAKVKKGIYLNAGALKFCPA